MNPTFCPDQRVLKTYRVVVVGDVSQATLERLTKGFPLKVGTRIFEASEIAAQHVAILGHQTIRGKNYRTVLTISISRGIRHHVRRMFEEVKHHVKELERTSLGPIFLGDLAPGQYRELTSTEYDFVANRFLNVHKRRARKKQLYWLKRGVLVLIPLMLCLVVAKLLTARFSF